MSGNPKNFIIDAIPLTRIPLSRQQYFSYEFERRLPAGTLVNISLFRRFLNGIVVNSRDDFHRLGNIKLKKIASIIEENFLTAEQLKLARFISDYYFCPLGVALKFFVPRRVKARTTPLTTYHLTQRKIKLTSEQQTAVNKITKNYLPRRLASLPASPGQGGQAGKPEARSYLLFGPASSGKTEVCVNAILKLKIQNSKFQFLILLPELTLIQQAIERYGARFAPEEVAVIHSKIPKGQLYAYWQKIKSGKVKIIIGTRMAVFAPFKNLKLIIIDEEQDASFKQWDMNPRYDARAAAEKLAEIHEAELVRGSAAPSIEAYYRSLRNEYKLIKLPKLRITNCELRKPQVEIVDIRKERWIKNYSPVSQKLRSEISRALEDKSRAFLLVNRRGMNTLTTCSSCGKVLRCGRCGRALIYDTSGYYRCLYCGKNPDLFLKCSHCKSTVFKNVGIGTQKIEKEMEKMFPGAKIKRVDADTIKNLKGLGKIYQDFSRKKIDIVIGGQTIAKFLPGARLAAAIDPDVLLIFPEYHSREKVFQQISALFSCVRKLGGENGKIIIQTSYPENAALRLAAKEDYENFYRLEINERQNLSYPPFAKFIKLIFRGKGAAEVEKTAQKVYNELLKAGGKNGRSKIFFPANLASPRLKGRLRKIIIIKLLDPRKNLPADIAEIIRRLDANWAIDIDPISMV
jgi:primosomal protein N' (replication factor Y) (superfamily II helicase)